jgi:hypothetical protein
MDKEAVVPDSRSAQVGFSLLTAVLAFVPVLFLLYGIVLADTPPDVGVRPGVKSTVGADGSTLVTDCGGTSLHVILRGPQVVAETSQQARVAESACRMQAWSSVVGGVLLFLLAPVGWYGASRAKRRYDRGGRLVDAEPSKQE